MFIANDGLLIALVAKAGTQSFMECCNGYEINNHVAINYPRRLLFIRHPIRRLESAFNFFKTLKVHDAEYNLFDVDSTPRFEGFVDHVLSGAKDEHWLPQSESVYLNGKNVANEIYRFEEINKYWPEFFPNNLRIVNSSIKHDTPEYRLNELIDYYSVDFDLWDNAVLHEGVAA